MYLCSPSLGPFFVAGTTLRSSTATNGSPKGTLFQGVGPGPGRAKPWGKETGLAPMRNDLCFSMSWSLTDLCPFEVVGPRPNTSKRQVKVSKAESWRRELLWMQLQKAVLVDSPFRCPRSLFLERLNTSRILTDTFQCRQRFNDAFGESTMWQKSNDKDSAPTAVFHPCDRIFNPSRATSFWDVVNPSTREQYLSFLFLNFERNWILEAVDWAASWR